MAERARALWGLVPIRRSGGANDSPKNNHCIANTTLSTLVHFNRKANSSYNIRITLLSFVLRISFVYLNQNLGTFYIDIFTYQLHNPLFRFQNFYSCVSIEIQVLSISTHSQFQCRLFVVFVHLIHCCLTPFGLPCPCFRAAFITFFHKSTDGGSYF